MVKNLPAKAKDFRALQFDPGWKISLEEEGVATPLQYACLGNPMEIGRSLAGYSPLGLK